MFKKAFLTIILSAVFLGNKTSFAAVQITTEQMVDTLYENENSETVKTLAKDLIMVCTGEKKPAKTYTSGLVEIGTYPRDYNGRIGAAVELITENELAYTYTQDSFTVYLQSEDILNENTFSKYKNRLSLVYDLTQKIKAATEGLSEEDSARYIAKYIIDTLSYGQSGSVGAALESGIGDCDRYVGLFYILGINSGLDVTCTDGLTTAGLHAWNKIDIDGNEFVVDATFADSTSNLDDFILISAEEYSIYCVKEFQDSWEVYNMSLQ